MDWDYTRERGPEWKHGWKDQSLSSISGPPLPLMLVFAIVIFLLSLSEYNSYKEQMHVTVFNFKILLLLLPVLLIFFVRSSLITGSARWFNFWSSSPSPRPGLQVRQELGRGLSGFPWGVAVLVLLLLVLVSYQSSFQSMLFPLAGSD